MKKVISTAVACALLGSAAANAQVSKAEFEQFKAQFEAMSERVNALEAENHKLRAASSKSVKVEDLAATNAQVVNLMNKTTASSWAEKVQLKGDYRFRYEYIDQEDKDSRTRWRVRARPVVVAKPSPEIEAGFGLGSGSDDPVSTNQTLGGGSTSKDVWIDLAYGTYTGVTDTTMTAGKMVNPYYSVEKSYLIYDGDFRPEGMAVGWTDKNKMFFALANYTWIESDSNTAGADGDHSYGIPGVQLGVNLIPIAGTTLTAAVGYIDVPTEGRPTIYDDKFFGNSSVKIGEEAFYEYNYEVANASLAFGFSAFDLPLSVYGDYIQNQDADDLNTGYMAGIRLGTAKKKGSWQMAYQYQELEADATLGEMTDSDFGGGGTDVKGNVVTGQYMITDNWYAGSTYFFDQNQGVDLGKDTSYSRLQIDTGLKY
jgi:Putative porin